MAIGALRQNLLIDNDRLAFHQSRLDVTLVASDARMPALEWQTCPRVMVERGRNPVLLVVTIGARRFACFGELARMDVFMAGLTNL